jgi:DNA polymerase/3'-5' exonuclease PolX
MKIPAEHARAVARDLLKVIGPSCQRLIFAGSLRRRKEFVSDIEILFIPSLEQAQGPPDLLGQRESVTINQTDRALDRLLQCGYLHKRENALGRHAWGHMNKLALHAETLIAVDLFTATEKNWFNYLVCRTGGEETNIRIAAAARAKGWKWNPYDEGFTSRSGIQKHPVTSERDVFGFVGIPYLEPWQR